ncbi:unnamed protein product [Rotaria sp. Silwood2]|nr:unnamed protein product [Rotaria sp. Silwood2]CAF3379971.1 unnamed protein product [Rotaria sp. Silwood2]CAF4554634.1 unnamed protein product [Rotaria sp. Silwood2]
MFFIDNAPCHPVNITFLNVKLQYFPPNITAKPQSLDQGIIQTFKTHYRKYLVKHIIECCATAQTLDDIKITYLDAIHWIDAGWKTVTGATIRNTFCVAGFKDKSNDNITAATSPSSNDPTTSVTDDEQSVESKKLDHLLQYVTIGGQKMSAGDFIDMDKDVPAFNEWFDNCENLIGCDVIELHDDGDDDEDECKSTESPPKITEAMEMIQKLHLLTTAQQPQLHSLINEIEFRLTDIYIDSKVKRQTTLEDFEKKLSFVL